MWFLAVMTSLAKRIGMVTRIDVAKIRIRIRGITGPREKRIRISTRIRGLGMILALTKLGLPLAPNLITRANAGP